MNKITYSVPNPRNRQNELEDDRQKSCGAGDDRMSACAHSSRVEVRGPVRSQCLSPFFFDEQIRKTAIYPDIVRHSMIGLKNVRNITIGALWRTNQKDTKSLNQDHGGCLFLQVLIVLAVAVVVFLQPNPEVSREVLYVGAFLHSHKQTRGGSGLLHDDGRSGRSDAQHVL